jgi:chloramphenicol-sensitive protein RarD
VLGTTLYHEPVSATRLVTFACVWIALAVFTGEALWRRRKAVAGTVATTP